MYTVSAMMLFIFDFFTVLGLFILHFTFNGTYFQKKAVFEAVFFSLLLAIVAGKYNSFILPGMLLTYFGYLVLVKKHDNRKNTIYLLWASILQSLFGEFSVWIVHLLPYLVGFKYAENALAIASLFVNYILIIITLYFYRRHAVEIIDASNQILDIPQFKNILLYFMILIFSILSTISVVSEIYEITANFQGLIVVTLTLILAVTTYFTLTIFRVIRYEASIELEKRQEKDYKRYSESLEHDYQTLRQFKHDYRNILITLNAYVKQTNNEEFTKYFNALLDYSERSNVGIDDFNNKITKIRSVPIQSLLTTKIGIAVEKHIEIKLEVDDPIEQFNVDELILSRLLSIIIDNAIEASQHQSKKQITIAFISYDDLNCDILVTNIVDNPDKLNINRWFANGYSTKGSTRGTGLKTLNRITSETKNISLEAAIVDDTVQIALMIEGKDALC